jgi:hypothetical protein
MSKFKKYSGGSFKQLLSTSYLAEGSGEEFLVLDVKILMGISNDPKVLGPMVDKIVEHWQDRGENPMYTIATNHDFTNGPGVMPAGTILTILTHSPDSNWATMLANGDVGSMRYVVGKLIGADLSGSSVIRAYGVA